MKVQHDGRSQLGLPALLGLLAFRQIRRRLADEQQTAAVAARFGVPPPPP